MKLTKLIAVLVALLPLLLELIDKIEQLLDPPPESDSEKKAP